MKKFLAFILLIIMFAGIAVSCAPNSPIIPPGSQSGETYNPDQGIDKDKVSGMLVDNKITQYSIIIPDDADECVAYAANELQKYFKQATGAVMSIRSDSSVIDTGSSKIISLGRTQFLSESNFDVDYSALNYDGFFIKSREAMLFIDGYRGAGVLYGVYDFVERVLGIVFLTEDVTHIPQWDSVPLYDFDRISVPAFSNRDHLSYQTMSQQEFSARLRFNSGLGANFPKYGDDVYYAGCGHTNFRLLPPDTYAAAHPDWYSSDLKEFNYTSGITDEGTFDASDTDSLAYTLLEKAKTIISGDTGGARYFMIGTSDNGSWSSDARTRASDAKYGQSGTLLIFINAIAEQLELWKNANGIEKEIDLVTFGYWKTIAPPTKVVDGKIVLRDEKVKARSNVLIMIGHMSCSYHAMEDKDCRVNEQFRNYFNGWQLVSDRLQIWDYCTNFDNHFFWFPNFGSIKNNYNFYKRIGVETVMTQGAPGEYRYYQAKLENYIISKLLWDPSRDINALMEEFNLYYFGDYAPAVNDFVNFMNYHYASVDNGSGLYHTELFSSGSFFSADNAPKGFLETAMDMIGAQIKAVKTDVKLNAVEKLEMEKRLLSVYIHPQYMLLHNYENYYDARGKRDFAKEFFKNTDILGISNCGENKTIVNLKLSYGIA